MRLGCCVVLTIAQIGGAGHIARCDTKIITTGGHRVSADVHPKFCQDTCTSLVGERMFEGTKHRHITMETHNKRERWLFESSVEGGFGPRLS